MLIKSIILSIMEVLLNTRDNIRQRREQFLPNLNGIRNAIGYLIFDLPYYVLMYLNYRIAFKLNDFFQKYQLYKKFGYY